MSLVKPITPAMRAILAALNAAPTKQLSGEECRKAGNLSHRGWRIVEGRMERLNVITRVYAKGSPVAMTLTGARSLGVSW